MKKEEIIFFIIAMSLGILTYFLLGQSPMAHETLTLTSDSFTNGGNIPPKYTCDGENISPQLSWNNLDSKDVQSYALIVDDPDAQQVVGKTYVHWIVLLSPTITALPEGISKNITSIDAAAKELKNDFGNHYYGGPCPPHGTHTYHFTLFALSKPVESITINAPCTADTFRKTMSSEIVTEATLTGNYTRRQ